MHTLVFLTERDAETVIVIERATYVCFGDHAGLVGRIEDRKARICGEERPHARIMHSQGMHTSTGSNAPDLDRSVAACRQDSTSIFADQNVSDVVGMTDEFGYALSSPRIPNAYGALGASASHYRLCDSQGIDAPFIPVQTSSSFVLSSIYAQLLSRSCKIPETDTMIEASTSDPVGIGIWNSKRLDIVCM